MSGEAYPPPSERDPLARGVFLLSPPRAMMLMTLPMIPKVPNFPIKGKTTLLMEEKHRSESKSLIPHILMWVHTGFAPKLVLPISGCHCSQAQEYYPMGTIQEPWVYSTLRRLLIRALGTSLMFGKHKITSPRPNNQFTFQALQYCLALLQLCHALLQLLVNLLQDPACHPICMLQHAPAASLGMPASTMML